jgi:glycosyltransferase involved in cell wall biosynthesis
VREAAGPNVELVGEVPREALRDLLRAARAFVFAADEDFGILPVEAQACGTPVIALGRGGARETVVGHPAPGATGLFFAEQSPGAIARAVSDFDRVAEDFRPESCVRNAARFGGRRFAEEFIAQVALAAGNRASRAR